MNVNPTAIVFGGSDIGVRVARSLGRTGVPVIGIGGEDAPLRRSRYCRDYVCMGRGSSDGPVHERWMEWLASDGPREGVLLPTIDEALELVVRHRRELVDLGYVPIEADDRVLAAMLDKERTYALARDIGIDRPTTATIRSRQDVDAIADDLQYPCALKPVVSSEFARIFGDKNKLLVAQDPVDLEQGWERMDALGLEMLVTEIVAGGDDRLLSYCGYLDERGEPLTQFTFRKLRQYPPHFGLGCYVVSDWNEEVINEGLRFLRGIGLRGVFHVEFKRDVRDDRLKLLECNHRFTIELIYSPRDLPLLTYNRLLGRPLPPNGRYRPGTWLWNPVEDVRAARSYRRRGELSWAAWLRSLLHAQHFHGFRWDDPMPTIAQHWRRVRRRFRRRLRPATAEERPSEPLLPG